MGVITLSIHSLLLGLTLTVIGFSALNMSFISKLIYDFYPKKTEMIKKTMTYNKGIIASSILMISGFILLIVFLEDYIRSGFTLKEMSKSALIGLLFFITGFQVFTFNLIINMIVNKNEANKRKEVNKNGLERR